MATIDLGKIKLVWRGTYAGGTAYTVDDVVQHTDSGITSSFICTTNSTGNAPSTGGSVHGSWAYLAKGSGDATLTTQGDVLYYGGSGLARLAAGTSGYFLKTQGGSANPVWAEVTAKFVKAQKFNYTSRLSIGTGSSDIALWTWGNFNKQSATSKLYYHGYCPGRRTENDHSFVKFTATPSSGSAETDNHNLSHGAHTAVSQMHLNLDGQFDTAFATGNVSLSMVLSSDGIANRGHSSGMIWNTNNSDDGRLPSTSSGSWLVIYEIED